MAADSSRPVHPVKNILIGVATTVVSTVIIYFLGFHSPESDEFKKTKQATIDAWESLMTYERSFKNAGTRMVCSGDINAMANDIVNEYGKIIDNIANIKDENKKKADNRIISLIDRRLVTLEEKKDATADYYKSLNQLDSLNLTQEQKDSIEIVYENRFLNKMNQLENQDKDFMNEVNADLKKKYHVEFKYPPPLMVTPEVLTGNWTLDREISLEMKKDLSFTWQKETKQFSGTWSLDYLTINFRFSDGSFDRYLITGGSDKVILMKFIPDSSFHYLCRN